jgi:lipoprotein-releasing system permease protein
VDHPDDKDPPVKRGIPLQDTEVVMATHRSRVLRGWIEVGLGVVGVIAGITIAITTRRELGAHVEKYAISFGPYLLGYAAIVIGTYRLLNASTGLSKPHTSTGKRNDISVGFGFKTFVAWRYLMARHHKISRFVLGSFFIALFAAATSMLLWQTILQKWNPLGLQPELFNAIARSVLIMMIAGFGLLYFTILIGLLRFVFSFFTTVPVVGVWIGTAALICVLSVMSGFETDLRQKILGSNAHIQVTAESGEIKNWRDIKDRIDKVPGVVASTPFAVSEVVIAANNNGMNVIIKGIDANTVGKVTKLVDSIKDDGKLAMQRLEPLVDDARDLTVPQPPATGSGAPVVDPAPDDLPAPGDPIDFSQPSEAVDPSQPPSVDDDQMPSPPPPAPGFGGDAAVEVGSAKDVLDPPPDDLVTTDAEPIDYSGDLDVPIEVVDFPLDQPTLSRRTQSLPGILVGQELVKQTHLYVGEEVRIVSPLSDPSNPDATGTPIPFNRDYRVAGIFFTGMYEYDLKYVYVTLDSLDDFLDRGDAVDGIEVRIGSADDTDAYVARLKSMLGKEFRVQDWKELNRSLFSALKLEKIAMFLVLGIVILVASFSIVGNLIMVVVEKAREIALIKTLGAADHNVMLVFAIQGLLIGFIGTAFGVGTGLIACWLGKEYGIPLNPDVYYIDKMPVNVETSSVLITAAAGVLISMLATFYPAVVAARVRPAAGMRH